GNYRLQNEVSYKLNVVGYTTKTTDDYDDTTTTPYDA
ncbi:hypothetical protein CEXT_215361, partial [Caerostris extrusa]